MSVSGGRVGWSVARETCEGKEDQTGGDAMYLSPVPRLPGLWSEAMALVVLGEGSMARSVAREAEGPVAAGEELIEKDRINRS